MPTLQQLDALADEIPIMNKKAADQARANRAVQMQSQIGSAQVAPNQNVARTAQAAAPGLAVAEGAAAAQNIQANTQALTDVAQTGLAVKGAAADASLQAQQGTAQEALASQEASDKLAMARQDIQMRKRVTGKEQASAQRLQKVGIELDNKLQVATIRQRQQLDALGGDVRAQILDSRLQFERDDMGRKFSNERQLADFVTANTKSQLEFADKAREVQQASQRKLQLMEIAEQKLSASLQQNWQAKESFLNNQNKANIARMVGELNERIRRETAARRGRMAMWQAGGTIIGAVIGGGTTMGAGAGVGAAAGGAVGTAIGGYAEGQRDG